MNILKCKQFGKNCIHHADCVEVLRELPRGSVDLIIADPPYYRMKGDFDFVFQSVPEYLAWCLEWVRECYRVLKPDGAFYCWGSSQMIDRLSVEVLDKFDWIKRNLIVWNYRTGRPAKATYRNEADFLWFYSNPLHEINIDAVRVPYDEGGKKDKRKNPKGKSCGNVWEFPRIMPNYRESTGHPTQKPEKLAERIILASSKAGDLIVIPFAGSGSEIVQCAKNNRYFIAAETNEAYVENMILPRLEKERIPFTKC
ncbi:MAG: site-specific DNA-methyltransferase [Lachnospiraceae bacterium]|nr:site-specific DNA-methyltransferase [Lachnospiraceae bacterium]